MITLTPNALRKLQSAKPPADAAKYLRLGVIGGGCSGYSYTMSWEQSRASLDKLFCFSFALEPETVTDPLAVVVDPISMMYLDGLTLGFAESLQQSGFTFDNPNAKKTCGCGSSFEVK